MDRYKHVIAAAFVAFALLSLAAGIASALRSIEASETTIFLLGERIAFAAAGLRVTCAIGMTIRLRERSIAKRPTNPIATASIKVLGQETGAERCEGGRFRFLSEREPFSVNYLSFTGTLPTITGLNVQFLRVAYLMEVLGQRCLISMNILGLQRVVNSELAELSGRPYTFESIAATALGGSICPEARQVSSEGVFNSKNVVRLRLV